MSRSNRELDNNAARNPATRFFEWAGAEGKLKWYDKESKQNYLVDLPFRFLVLDQLNTVTGYNEKLEVGYYANEVRDLRDTLTVKASGGVMYKSGPWASMKEDANLSFTKSIYIAFHDDTGEMVLGHIKFRGSALGELGKNGLDKAKDKPDEYLKRVGWFGFCGTVKDIYDGAVEITDAIWDKKGTNSFYRPVFKQIKCSEESAQRAQALDEQLQAYLAAYFAREPQEERASAATANESQGAYFDDEEDIRFRNSPPPAPPEDFDDQPF